jgi:hypothetical protein
MARMQSSISRSGQIVPVLVPLSRVNEKDACRLTKKLLEDPLSTRELSRLYEHYKKSNRGIRDRIIVAPSEVN